MNILIFKIMVLLIIMSGILYTFYSCLKIYNEENIIKQQN